MPSIWNRELKTIFRICVFVSTLLLLYYHNNKKETPNIPKPNHYHSLTKGERLQKIKHGVIPAQEKNSELAPKSDKNYSLTKVTTPRSLPCGGNCHIQVQLCAFFPSILKPGTYCCSETGCQVTLVNDNRYLLQNNTDVIIFFQHGKHNLEELSRTRRPHHAWVFLTREAAPKVAISKSAIYNWSMTHRSDSDFRIPYGVYNKKVPTISSDKKVNWLEGKTKLVAWVASNCDNTGWPRLEFVRNLSKQIDVDMYGKCGDKKCTRGNRSCTDILRKHKFYLALESQVCKDYITEKFWSNALKNNLVPIVYGTPRSEYEKWVPPHSFIHVNDFENMEALVNYIKLLDQNDALYSEYFEWQRQGSVEVFGIWQWFTFEMICDIAKKYLQHKRHSKTFHLRHDFWDYSCRREIKTVF